MNLNAEILKLADEYEQYIIDCRRKVHTFAEVATTEKKTHAFIVEEAKRLGLPYEEVPTYSVIVKLDTGRPGKTILLRADIDALQVVENENNLAGPRTCRSEQPGTCHACGHDAHTAMLLGAMNVLTRLKDQFSGTVVFAFEEGEECGSGKEALLAALDKYNVERVWAIHVYAGLEEGKISVDAGPRMAGAAVVNVTFRGRSGHASRPDLAANPIFAASSYLTNLCVAFCNQVTAGQTVTMAVPMIHGGEASNVIDETAYVRGSFRFFDFEEGQAACDRAMNIAHHTAAMFKCTAEMPEGMKHPLGGPVVNDKACAADAQRALKGFLPEGTVVECEPWYASDSMGYYLRKWPGVYAFLGIKNEAEGYGALHHNDKFDLNEKILRTGAISTVRVALEWLSEA
ncbi:MAG: amidohydrolase [Angelakisella sp.]|jgi:amidohydrolase|nr:amidohydrolase [Angelakisella sp.]